MICLEPEAAAIYCKWLPIERDNELLNIMKPGRRFFVLDAGGNVKQTLVKKNSTCTYNSLPRVFKQSTCM